MRAQQFRLNVKNQDFFNYYIHNKGSSNSDEIARKNEFLTEAIIEDLTPMQRYCLTEYHLNGVKQKDIAAKLGINSSTVSRHIAAATKKLRRTARLYR